MFREIGPRLGYAKQKMCIETLVVVFNRSIVLAEAREGRKEAADTATWELFVKALALIVDVADGVPGQAAGKLAGPDHIRNDPSPYGPEMGSWTTLAGSTETTPQPYRGSRSRSALKSRQVSCTDL